MWLKLDNSSISMREVQIYEDLNRETYFFERWSWFKFNSLGVVLGMGLKICSTMANVLKLKVTTFWGLILLLEKLQE